MCAIDPGLRRDDEYANMLISFLLALKNAGLPVTLKELLTLLEALQQDIVFASLDDFYILSRTLLVKDEKYYDRFDRAFGLFFRDLQSFDDVIEALIPDDWLRREFLRQLSEEDKAKIQSLGGLDQLLETFKQRLKEQQSRHQGGNKWIGTGGTSPFGHSGYHPEGIRIGGESRNKKAVKVWERRDFRNLDDSVELGTRNLKVALRRLRQFARSGAADELDLDDTIRSTARNAGFLDLKMVPEKHNAVKVLLFLDIGGSMDPFVRLCEELFSAARTEFKHLEYFYFHNFFYESVWKDNHRRHNERISTWDILNTYGSDYRVIIIGDAAMSPYEVVQPGGSVEHWNDEAGEVWFRRIRQTYQKLVWLNPSPPEQWDWTMSTQMINKLLDNHMYPLTLAGLDAAIAELAR
jgi:hypothetical protein